MRKLNIHLKVLLSALDLTSSDFPSKGRQYILFILSCTPITLLSGYSYYAAEAGVYGHGAV